jgi:AcrR family transcriptional regulator
MPQETTDRRVRRTRQLLRDALMELALERGYDRVTVQDILDRADVGRSTFYAHYRDKDDLLVSEFESLHPTWAGEATEPGAGSRQPMEFLEPFRTAFRDAEANRRQFRLMMGSRGSESVRRLLPEPLSNLMREHLRAQFPGWQGDEQQLEVAVQFIVSACLGTLTWWLDTDAPYAADDIFDICRRMASDGANSFFGGAARTVA